MKTYELPTTLYLIGDTIAVRIPSDFVKLLSINKGMRVSVKNTSNNTIEFEFLND